MWYERSRYDSRSGQAHVPTALQIGCLTGLVTACIPACACGLTFQWLVHTLRRWILSWNGPDAELSVGGLLGGTTLRVSLDMQKHLQVTDFVKMLTTLDNGWWWTIPLLTLALTLLGGLVLAAIAAAGAGLYNWTIRRR